VASLRGRPGSGWLIATDGHRPQPAWKAQKHIPRSLSPGGTGGGDLPPSFLRRAESCAPGAPSCSGWCRKPPARPFLGPISEGGGRRRFQTGTADGGLAEIIGQRRTGEGLAKPGDRPRSSGRAGDCRSPAFGLCEGRGLGPQRWGPPTRAGGFCGYQPYLAEDTRGRATIERLGRGPDRRAPLSVETLLFPAGGHRRRRAEHRGTFYGGLSEFAYSFEPRLGQADGTKASGKLALRPRGRPRLEKVHKRDIASGSIGQDRSLFRRAAAMTSTTSPTGCSAWPYGQGTTGRLAIDFPRDAIVVADHGRGGNSSIRTASGSGGPGAGGGWVDQPSLDPLPGALGGDCHRRGDSSMSSRLGEKSDAIHRRWRKPAKVACPPSAEVATPPCERLARGQRQAQ